MKIYVLFHATNGPDATSHLTKRAALNKLDDAMDNPIDRDNSIPDDELQRLLNQHFDENRTSLWDYWEIHETELKDALVLPMTAKDNAILDMGDEEAPDIEWRSRPQDRLWIGINGLSVKIKHEDEGVVIDIYEAAADAEAIASTWTEFPEEETCPEYGGDTGYR